MAQYGKGTNAWARRNAIARAKGFKNYNEYRRASKAEREAATKRAAEAGVYKTPQAAKTSVELVTSPPARRRLHDLGGGRQLLHSMNNRELYAFLVRAERNELRVFALVTIDADRKIPLWKRGGIDPSHILDELRPARSNDVVGWIADYMVNALGYPPGTVIRMIDMSSGAANEGDIAA